MHAYWVAAGFIIRQQRGISEEEVWFPYRVRIFS